MLLNDDPWSEGIQPRFDRLAASGAVGPMIVALPDCFTRYGGAQYIDSAATGRYEAHLWQELLPAVRAKFSIGRVGVAGKSSGGYGAIVQAMRHPEIVSAVASHSGDMYFDYCFPPHFPAAVRELRARGGPRAFLDHFAAAPKKREGRLFDVMCTLAMAACFSPDASELGFALPFDLETGEIDHAVWSRWLAWDPVRMIEHPPHAEALAGMRLVFLDAGTRDEFQLDLGARVLSGRMRRLGIGHRHEEFEDGHMNIPYRYDVSLPLLYRALA
jgi:enterochelin esterase family protein